MWSNQSQLAFSSVLGPGNRIEVSSIDNTDAVKLRTLLIFRRSEGGNLDFPTDVFHQILLNETNAEPPYLPLSYQEPLTHVTFYFLIIWQLEVNRCLHSMSGRPSLFSMLHRYMNMIINNKCINWRRRCTAFFENDFQHSEIRLLTVVLQSPVFLIFICLRFI